MKIVDINVALDGRKPSTGERVTVEMLYEFMKAYRIDHCVAYHKKALFSPLQGNTEILRIAAESNGKIGACVILNTLLMEAALPGEGTLRERLIQLHPEAIRLCPDNNHLLFHKFYWGRLLDELRGLKIPVIVDCEHSYQFWADFPAILEAYPDINFVILRSGYKRQWMMDPLLRTFPNVYVDMSIMVDGWQVEECYEIDQCRHLVFGSGFPEFVPTGGYGLAMYADVPVSSKEGMLALNWEAMAK